MTETIYTGTIRRIDRARSSSYGNPSFWITFADGERYRTKDNAGWAYVVGNPGMREGSRVECELSPKGQIRTMRALAA